MKPVILLTGANGLLGQKLVDLIVEKSEFHLIATGRGPNRLSRLPQQYDYQTLDITDEFEIKKVFEIYEPEVVIHTAAMTNVDTCELEKEACWLHNVVATRYIAEACLQYQSHLVHVSTDFVFDGTKGPLTEEDKPAPVSFYGYSKLAAEELIMNIENLHWAIARTILVYGVAQDMSRSNIILWVKKSLEEKRTIKVVDDQWRTPTLAEDLAKGCYALARQKETGIFNIAGKDFLTPLEMAIKVADYFNLDRTYITRADSSTFTQPAKRPPKTGLVIDKARKILGYEPVTFDEGIALVANQLQALRTHN